MSRSRDSTTLGAAAFGDEPGRWPLPPAHGTHDHWWRAVAAGGQGYYAVALSDLAVVRRSGTGPLVSLAHSTTASLVRQLGWHGLARGWDGRALLLAGEDTEARVDALVGLSADALGMGRYPASSALLDRARADLAAAEDPDARLAVRLRWVSAELAMATGDGAMAVGQAEEAVALAGAPGVSERHRVKSEVVLAAALCCAGRVDTATARADAALERADRDGLVPLRWALASLLAGIGSAAYSESQVLAIRAAAAETVCRRGGTWSGH